MVVTWWIVAFLHSLKGYSSSRDPLSLDISQDVVPAVKNDKSETSQFLASWLNIEAEYPVIVDHDKMNNPILPLCT